MRRNVAGQFIGCQLIAKADGSALTTGNTTVYITGDAGNQALGSVGSGECSHEGNGFWSYAPSQAETNYTHIAFTFVNTLAVPTTVQIYPIAYGSSGQMSSVELGTDQAVNVTKVNGTAQTAGDLAALITTVDTVIDALPSAAAIADAVWDEAISGHSGAGSTGLALSGATAPTAAAVADAVWDEALSGHTTAGTAGLALAGASAPSAATVAAAVWDEVVADHLDAGSTGAALAGAGDPWATVVPGAYSAGTAGQVLGDYLDATVSGVMTRLGTPVDTNIATDINNLTQVTVDTNSIAAATATAVVSAIGSTVGVGSEQVSIEILVNGSPVDGAAVYVTSDPEGQNVMAGTVFTDAFGKVDLLLDPGVYYLWKQHAGFNFTNPETIEVTD